MKWTKLGHIFSTSGDLDWMNSHATAPTPYHIGGNDFRVYFSSRNSMNQNQVGFIEIDITNPKRILNISKEPVISLGDLGFFDCDGIYGTSLVKDGDKLYFYYAGWNAGLRGLFNSAIGVAISLDNGRSFEKFNEIPILQRSIYDKWAVMAPFVLKEDNHWSMWYSSGYKLFREEGQLRSYYDIKYAKSRDGLSWESTGIVSIPLINGITNIARPSILFDNDIYKVWFPYVTKNNRQYQIGYGTSKNGRNFEMDTNWMKFQPSSELNAFDHKAVTYPFVFDHAGQRYMLYNGDQFGKTGFGLAILE